MATKVLGWTILPWKTTSFIAPFLVARFTEVSWVIPSKDLRIWLESGLLLSEKWEIVIFKISERPNRTSRRLESQGSLLSEVACSPKKTYGGSGLFKRSCAGLSYGFKN